MSSDDKIGKICGIEFEDAVVQETTETAEGEENESPITEKSQFKDNIFQIDDENAEIGYFCVGQAVHLAKLSAFAENLQNFGSLGSKTDPYFKLTADMNTSHFADLQVEDKLETKTLYKSETINNKLTPEWKDALDIEVPVGTTSVTCTVYHDKLGSDIVIGSCEIPFKNKAFLKGVYDLGEDDKGETYGTFSVGAEKIEFTTFAMLHSTDPDTKLSKRDNDAYFKIKMGTRDLTLYKSHVDDKGHWGETVFKAPETAKSVTIEVWDKDTLSKDDLIGTCEIPLVDGKFPKSAKYNINAALDFAVGDPVKFIASASNLINKDTLGKSDPYFKLYCGENYVYKSEVKDDNLNPIWSEASFFPPEGTNTLTLKVFDDDKGGDDLIGQCEVPFPLVHGEYDLGKDKKGKDAGQFQIQDMETMKNKLITFIQNSGDMELFDKVQKSFLKAKNPKKSKSIFG